MYAGNRLQVQLLQSTSMYLHYDNVTNWKKSQHLNLKPRDVSIYEIVYKVSLKTVYINFLKGMEKILFSDIA